MRPSSLRSGGSNPSLCVRKCEESSSGSKRKIVNNEKFWRDYLSNLSFQDIAKLGALQKEIIAKRFYTNKKSVPLSRNIYRVFSDQDLLDFFSIVKSNEVKMGIAFFLQLTCGFRIGEINPIKVEHIDFKRGVISLMTEKANLFSDQPVPSLTLEVLGEWIEHNKK